jgi:DNA-binding NtrC family response regulator
MAITHPSPDAESRRVLLIVEDASLSDLLAEALVDAGHKTLQVETAAAAEAALLAQPFDALIVDLDTRARDGVDLVSRARRTCPSLTVIALLPCGGLLGATTTPAYHLAIEKPAKLAAVLSAVRIAPSVTHH